MNYRRKVRVHCPEPWNHHTGWPYCVSGMLRDLHTPNGIVFFTNGVVGRVLERPEPINEPWIGFLHASPIEQVGMWPNKNPSCKESLSKCKGIFALTNLMQKVVEQELQVQSEVVRLAVGPGKCPFDPNRFAANPEPRLIMIGHWLRQFDSIYRIKADRYRRTILRCTNHEHDPAVEIMPFQQPNQYEKLFEDNVVFLDLIDAAANNTVIECIVRNTPILVNRLPGVIEHLGSDYPLFYDSLDECEELLQRHKILEAHRYLRSIDKTPYQLDTFIRTIHESNIYKSLPSVPKLLL